MGLWKRLFLFSAVLGTAGLAGRALADPPASSPAPPATPAAPGDPTAAPSAAPTPSPAPGSDPAAAPPSIVAVSVWRDGSVKALPLDFQMGDAIIVRLSPGGYAALQAVAVDTKKKLGLFLNGHFLSDVAPIVIGHDEISFTPTRNDASKGFWDALWGGRLLSLQGLAVSIGLEDASILIPATTNLSMHPLQGPRAAWIVMAGLLLLALTIGLAVMTSIVRDGPRNPGGKLPTYSLGRSQMAFWFINVVLAVLLIWAVTGSVPSISTSVLGLMGIGAGTALGAAIVDATGANPTPPSDSRNFLIDVLTDGKAIALHRFQMFVWTLVMFFIFWGAVWNRLALPDFDSTLLGLMGISAGAYLGFKFPENQPPPKAL